MVAPVLAPQVPQARLAPDDIAKQVTPADHMPQLPAAQVPRRPLHTRQITCTGYEREDGLFEVEAQLSDVRDWALDGVLGGHRRAAGEPLHLMSLRVVVDSSFTIVDVQAVTHQGPYDDCGGIAPNYRQLVGLRIAQGFNQQVKALFKGAQGCTHITDLVAPLATTALQTIRPLLMRRHAAADGQLPDEGPKPALLDSCHGLRRGGEPAIVRWGRIAQVD